MKGSVRFENVTKCFGDVVALKPLSLEIRPGTLVTLLGPLVVVKPLLLG